MANEDLRKERVQLQAELSELKAGIAAARLETGVDVLSRRYDQLSAKVIEIERREELANKTLEQAKVQASEIVKLAEQRGERIVQEAEARRSCSSTSTQVKLVSYTTLQSLSRGLRRSRRERQRRPLGRMGRR
jgi:hypothetical protein